MKKQMTRIVAVIAAGMLVGSLPTGLFRVNAAETAAAAAAEPTQSAAKTDGSAGETADPLDVHYWDLLEKYESSGKKDYTGSAVELPLNAAQISGGSGRREATYDGKTALLFDEAVTALSFSVTVPESALYQIECDYYAYNDKSTDIQRSLLVDGVLPCVEWNNLRLTRLFEDDGAVRVDVNGDESAPRMKQVFAWQTTRFSDDNGYYSGPMKLYLTAGTHTLTLSMQGNQPVAFSGLRLVAPVAVRSYREVAADYTAQGYREATEAASLYLEGEDTLTRSSASLRLEAARDLSCSPTDAKNAVINVAGGSSWKKGRQTLTWQLEVKETGLYRLALHRYSYYNYGCAAYRRICLDGAVPFAELEAYRFRPSTQWQTEILGSDEGEPYLFYLTAGTHTLSMQTVTGELTDIIRQLDTDMDVLSDLYLNITLITTSDPDTNYDYQLDKKMPALMDTLRTLHDNLGSSADRLKTICGEEALTYSEMCNTQEDLAGLMRDVFEIPSQLDQFTTMLSQYGNWISALKAGTVSIDSLQLLSPAATPQETKVSFWQRLYAGVVSFFATFTKDYSAVIGDGTFDEERMTIDVWYGGTQIWAAEIQDLVESSFVPQHNIQVRFKLTPTSQMSTGINAMLLAILSDTAPDAVLSAASIEDYAMRNQCYDLRQFADFDEVAKRFPAVCFDPLTYQGKTYGLPQALDVKVMFYRTDIFKQLGLSVPETWDDMIGKVIPKLAENSMMLAASPGYQPLLFQMGGELYNEDMTKSAVASQISWKAFKMHCDFYTMYGVPKTANFFNRFRSGETPVGFGGLADYIQFIYAAPELAGRWSVALMPGTRQADGSVNHNIGGLLSEAAMIMAQARHPEEAWTFLKWYTETKTQVEISEQIEAKLDMSARLKSANSEAFADLDWDRDDLKVFQQAMTYTKAYNPVLGSYYTARYLDYAYNYVVISKTMTEREALEYAEENINNELQRRRNGLS